MRNALAVLGITMMVFLVAHGCSGSDDLSTDSDSKSSPESDITGNSSETDTLLAEEVVVDTTYNDLDLSSPGDTCCDGGPNDLTTGQECQGSTSQCDPPEDVTIEDISEEEIADSAIPSEIHNVVILWLVTSGSPDYVYVFGQATVDGTTVTLDLDDDPPVEAINSYGLGVGTVLVMDPGCSLPEGKYVEGLPEGCGAGAMLGLSAEYSIIYKTNEVLEIGWTAEFPLGYSCGKCVSPSGGEMWDTLVPVDCGDVKVNMDPEAHACNWT